MSVHLSPGDFPFLQIDPHEAAWMAVVGVPNTPRTHATGVHGEPGREALRVRLKALPEGGKANDARIKWLAGCLEAPPKAITLVRGETSRHKRLRLSATAANVARWDKLRAAIAT